MERSNYKSSRYILAICLTISLCLHLFICKIPVESAMLDQHELNKLSFSIVSLSQPSVLTDEEHSEKKVENIEKVEKSKITKKTQSRKPEKKESKLSKAKSIVSDSNIGKKLSNVIPVLNESEFIKTVAPKYPRRSIERGQQGLVMVKVKLEKGVAKTVDISKSSGFSMLDKSAVKAVKKWQFSDYASSKSSSGWVQIPVKFIIK